MNLPWVNYRLIHPQRFSGEGGTGLEVDPASPAFITSPGMQVLAP
jgi:hypothetical protein